MNEIAQANQRILLVDGNVKPLHRRTGSEAVGSYNMDGNDGSGINNGSMLEENNNNSSQISGNTESMMMEDGNDEIVSFFMEIERPEYIPSRIEQPPASVVLRPYWMMRLLANTITRGGYLHDGVYLSPTIWLHPCGLKDLLAKQNALEQLTESLSDLRKLTPASVTNVNI